MKDKIKEIILALSFSVWVLIAFSGCDNSTSCVNCGGGLVNGYLYKTVAASDLSSIPELELESCIRFKYMALSDEEIDPESVEMVDDCCCKEYEFEL